MSCFNTTHEDILPSDLFIFFFRFPKNNHVKRFAKIVSEHDQKTPQSQTADNPVTS